MNPVRRYCWTCKRTTWHRSVEGECLEVHPEPEQPEPPCRETLDIFPEPDEAA
jgi:hypothetical protein